MTGESAAVSVAAAPVADPAESAPPRSGRPAIVGTALLLGGLVAVLLGTFTVGGSEGDPARLPYWYAAGWALFAAALLALRKVPRRAASVLVLAGGVALALTGLIGAPRTSNDMYRYAWDGRVQAAGISPYAYPPDAPELRQLREPWLFPAPAGGRCADWTEIRTTGGDCTRINRPHVHTIYPPVAEGWFFAVHAVSPPGARWKPLQVGGALLAVATTGALLLALRRHGADPRRAALWAWCPIVPVTAVNDAHIDTLGVLLTVLALGVATGLPRRGALLGAAVAVKILPVLALPGTLARRGPRETLRGVLPALAVIVLAYLPYVLASGGEVLGYLPGYLKEEGYEPGGVRRFALVRLVLPDGAAGPAAVAGVLAVALYVLRRGDPGRPWRGALTVTGTALLLTSPSYYWYALLIVGLVALDGRWEWLAVPLAGLALYAGDVLGSVPGGNVLQASAYGAAALVVATGALARRRARNDARANACGSTVDTSAPPCRT
ncbi:glycosyltransferase family 87 protein [Actinacidiphila alni]|uniref:glycosyltransferase family 87 protein n=1 Tax=Actinacidiphila alni TaxID=380248 RepID=UPI0034000DDA